jgi:ribonuclease P protein component
MLPPQARLRSSRGFGRAVRRGRRSAKGCLVVHVARRESGDEVRIGLIVAKSVGGAVVRNLVKRRLRHALSERLNTIAPGTDLVVRALPAAGRASFQRLDGDLAVALSGIAARGGRA